MPHIKKQKLVRGDSGSVLSGTASIVDTVYDNKRKGNCSHPVIEKLGKIIWLSDSGRSGIFLSPTRGLIEYDADSNSFSEIERGDSRVQDDRIFPEPVIHTVFGDSYNRNENSI